MPGENKRILRFHVGLALAEILCAGAFALELSRALRGNSLSWAYVFEWPLFGGYALYMWRRMVRDERAGDAFSHDEPRDADTTDPRLAAYNEYLGEVHARETRHP